MTGTRMIAGPQGSNGVKMLESYANENSPRKETLWTSPINPRNATAPSPVTTPTNSANSDRGNRPSRRAITSGEAAGAAGTLVAAWTVGHWLVTSEALSSTIADRP